jgi:hypothetical protein
MDLILITRLASQMRKAIEAVPRAELPLPMSCFPRGACGDACLLLGAYFADQGINGFEYVCGERGSKAENTWTSHAWLADNELVVDITADQFNDAPSAVIVASPSIWHRRFEINHRSNSDFRLRSGFGVCHLTTMYSRLKPVLAGISLQ